MIAIEAKDLYKKYVNKRGWLRRRVEEVEALKGVSFIVEKGTVFGLLGPNGAGKTTTVKILATLLLPDKGTARIMGYDVVEEARRVREVIGVSLSVERGFFWKLTGYENLKYFGMLRGLDGKYLEERIQYVMELLGLKKLKAHEKFYEEFSLGMKARLSIARALLHDPEVLILDEPTLGLDPSSARAIRELLVKLAHEEGKTILITSHNMFEVEMICDKVAIINKGEIIAHGTVAELKRLVSKEVPVSIEAWRPGVVQSRLAELVSEKLGLKASVIVDDKGFAKIRILAPLGEEDKVVHEVLELLRSVGARIREAKILEPTLEDVFIKLTGGVEQ
ncbi:ABC transporter ATP-binding protein [Desulfurococcaceae archaeon MEX13E-LK6-19]|nr:ABC transporter ATP-binding protein [Desulfurococcaceae archaeon MEX13E-LK6-19]